MLEMISQAACAVTQKFPERDFPLLIGNISKRLRGSFGHASHQTGLDADIGFYNHEKAVSSFWKPLDGNFDKNFDYEKNWMFLKALQSTEEQRLMIVFVDQKIKDRLCQWVKKTEGLPKDPESAAYKALRHLRHWSGHNNHFHVRLYCPDTAGCQNMNADPNFSGTGCK
jgi:penicillin-insensitive murein endopeptidase